jgi:4'-phosphopantetheinyl transferase EntD
VDAVGLLGAVLPATVTAVARLSDDDDAPLHPSEEAAVARAVASRRAEFTTGRWCAREALAALGAPAAAIPVGEERAPVWPAGVVGSITHTRGFRGAAVAWRSTVRSVGIDAEVHDVLPDRVLDVVSSETERALLERLSSARPDVAWDRLLFSAKESVYKTWFPLTGRWLGFEDAELVPSEDGTFTTRLLVEGPTVDGAVVESFVGRWAVADGILVTAIALPAR